MVNSVFFVHVHMIFWRLQFTKKPCRIVPVEEKAEETSVREKLWTAGEVREVEGGKHHIAIHLHLHLHLNEMSMSLVHCQVHIVHIFLHLHLNCPLDVQGAGALHIYILTYIYVSIAR